MSLLRAVVCNSARLFRAEVRQRMTLEPSPQIFDRIQIGRVRRQESNLDVAIDAVQIIPDQFRPVRFEAIPDNQERLLEVGFERLRNSTISSFLMLPS